VLLNDNPNLFSGWGVNRLVEDVLRVKPQSDRRRIFWKRPTERCYFTTERSNLGSHLVGEDECRRATLSAAFRCASRIVLNSFLLTLPEPPGSPIAAEFYNSVLVTMLARLSSTTSPQSSADINPSTISMTCLA
jgi:hypothetical protein